MFHCVSLCFTVFHCVSLCFTVFYCVSLCFTMFHCVSLCFTVFHYVSLCFTLNTLKGQGILDTAWIVLVYYIVKYRHVEFRQRLFNRLP